MQGDPPRATVRVTATHLLAGEAIGGPSDALAISGVTAGGVAAARFFIPGVLPCGECALCRRALCVACAHARPAFGGAGAATESADDLSADLPERFLAGIADEQSSPLHLATAGLVAEVIGAAARAGLGPGETAVWIGASPWVRLGASWSARRGCRTFLLPSAAGDTIPADVERLDPNGGAPNGGAPNGVAGDWRRAIEVTEAAGGPTGGRPERKIFVYGAAQPLAAAALALAVPGSTLSFLRGVPDPLTGLDTGFPLRVFTGSAFHPDLIPESLAAIRRAEIDVDGILREVAPAERGAAVADFLDGRDPRLPLIAFPAEARVGVARRR